MKIMDIIDVSDLFSISYCFFKMVCFLVKCVVFDKFQSVYYYAITHIASATHHNIV